ncbi:MAG: radical SAM protein [Deltaproteobacteria bacterium]|nr:radical SAM protein [Deltaproteobacteria bacterium]
MDIKLSYACNNNCVHCVVADQRVGALEKRGRDFRTTAEVVAELESAAARGFEVVTFTGGEPTLRKDLPLLVKRARDLGLAVGLQTNARVLAYGPARAALLKMDVRFVVAVHGPDKEIHDAVTRAPGSFDQTIEAVRRLTEAGEKVTGKVVISRLNSAVLPDIAQVLVRAGAHRVNFTFPHGLGNAASDFEGVVPRYRDVIGPLRRAASIVSEGGGLAVTEAVPLCILGELADIASENLYRRYYRSEVRQLDQEPRDWSRDRLVEGKSKPQSCSQCILDNRCEGVWKEYLETFGGEEMEPVTRPDDGAEP